MTARITFLCSGGGGNLKLVHILGRRGLLPVEVTGVIADRECPAIRWAKSQGIAADLAPYTKAHPEALHALLEHQSADLVVTTIHKILDNELVAKYAGRLVNLHYSLLPAFGGCIGMEPVARARKQGCRLVGATAHHVTPDVDAGAILAQACVADDTGGAIERLQDAVFRCGATALAGAIEGMLAPGSQQPGGVVDTGDVQIFAAPQPSPQLCSAFAEPQLWASFR